jgi:hypothetical protein
MKNHSNRTILIILLALIVMACNKKATEIAPTPDAIKIGSKYIEPADKGFITNVVKQANTAEVKLTTMGNFIKEEGGKLYFKNSADEVKSLKPGSVVLFEGYALRKVTSIAEANGQIVVSATKAKFTEYYKSAKVTYNQKMDWSASSLRKARVNMGGKLSAFKENSATNALEFGGEIKGWKLSLKLSPEPNGSGQKLNIDLDAKKERVAKIVGKGYISDFEAQSQIDVANSQVNTYNHENSNLNGELDVKYTFLSMREAATIEIPLEFERTILVEGVIPVTFKLKCVLKVFPEIAQNSTCQAHLKLTYNGTQGFNYSSGGLAPRGIINDFEGIIQSETGSASSGIVGVGVGLEFPRFSIGLFGELIVPYIVNNTSVISYFESGLPFVPGPCNQTRLKLKGEVGVDMTFLGVKFTQKADLYEREKKFEKEGSKCPATDNSKRAEAIAQLNQSN